MISIRGENSQPPPPQPSQSVAPAVRQREYFARQFEELLSRADSDDSEAFSLSSLKKIFKIGGIALDGANILGNLLP